MKTKIYKCEKCSTEVNDSQTFCHNCGSKFDATTNKVDEKEKIVQQLVKWGNNEEESKKMVEKEYEYVNKTYKDSSIKKKAEIIRSIG